MNKLSHIVCMAKNSVIGLKGRLPWDLDEDMKRFKYLTMGRAVLMGRETFDSIPLKLEGRRVFVLSRSRTTEGDYPLYVRSLDEALHHIGEGSPLMIAGGESVYRSTLDLVDDIYLTLVDYDFKGDSHYSTMEELLRDFELDYEKKMEAEIPYSFMRLVRRDRG